TEDRTEKYLVGYYTIAPKFFSISKDDVSHGQYKKLSQYGEYDTHLKKCTISAILIGQLGKNFSAGNDTLITGDELLSLALEKVKSIQNEIGGRYTYLECEDNEKLLDFYKNNGFIPFGKRNLDSDETDINGAYLIQLLKKI
ncbi:MAG: N-acetyltransferase, partial [Eubacteriales bacterium]|nr:N-acetyltransferase [Eubacteriales bacterium]